jgi:hypothetical protein
MTNKCIVCGNIFEAARATAKYCSIKCKHAFHRDELSVPENILSVPERNLSVPENDDVAPPVPYLSIEKDLKLNLEKDLGCIAWTQDGIFIRPEITIQQVRNIRRVVEAKHGWKKRTYTHMDAPAMLYSHG